MARKEPYASREEFSKRVVRYPDIPSVELFPGAKSHLVLAENVTVSFITMSPNYHFATHRHESEQIMIVIDGEIDEIVEGKLYHLEKGDVLVLPPNTEHGAYTSKRVCQAIDIFSPPRKDLVAKLKEVSGKKPTS